MDWPWIIVQRWLATLPDPHYHGLLGSPQALIFWFLMHNEPCVWFLLGQLSSRRPCITIFDSLTANFTEVQGWFPIFSNYTWVRKFFYEKKIKIPLKPQQELKNLVRLPKTFSGTKDPSSWSPPNELVPPPRFILSPHWACFLKILQTSRLWCSDSDFFLFSASNWSYHLSSNIYWYTYLYI